jgi:hypothetical protein
MRATHFLKVIEFMTANASHDPYAPRVQQGVQVHLNNYVISFVSITCGMTTTATTEQRESAGVGSFILPFDDIETFMPTLRDEETRQSRAGISFVKSIQPYVPGRASLRIQIGDYFEAHLGTLRTGHLPSKSNETNGALDSAKAYALASDMRHMGQTNHLLRGEKLPNNGFRVELFHPKYSLKRVQKLIY